MDWGKAIAELLAFVNNLFAAFKKSATETIIGAKEKIREGIDHMKKTGRPK